MGREVGGRFKRQGTYVYPWLIHVDVWQKLTRYCRAIIFQFKIKRNNETSITMEKTKYLTTINVAKKMEQLDLSYVSRESVNPL